MKKDYQILIIFGTKIFQPQLSTSNDVHHLSTLLIQRLLLHYLAKRKQAKYDIFTQCSIIISPGSVKAQHTFGEVKT